MRVDAARRPVAIVTFVFYLLFAHICFAQEGPAGSFYWDVSQAKDVTPGLKKALGADVARHYFGADDLAKQLSVRSIDVPPCFLGVESCTSPYAMIFDAFDLSGVVRILKTEKGLTYQLVDRRKEIVVEGSVAESDASKNAFKIVSELFNATATVVIETVPADATVTIAENEPTTAPVQMRLPVGSYRYVVEKSGYERNEGSVELASGGVQNLTVELVVIPATMRFSEVTKGAEVFVDGMLVGPASQPITLKPGNHTIEIRKEGFQSIHEAVDVEAGQVLERRALLQSNNPLLRDVSVEAIAHRKYHLRIGFEHGIQRATFQDARTSDGTRFVGLADDSGILPPGDPFRQLTHNNGVRFGALYQLRHVGLALMSASFVTGSPDRVGFVDDGSGTDVEVTVDKSTRLQVRPFQLNYRRFYKNFVPSIELGIGIDFHWFDARRTDDDTTLDFRRVESFWTLGFTGQYFITNGLFGFAKYGYQDYFTPGPGADHLFNIGVGVAFGNLLGFDPEPPETL